MTSDLGRTVGREALRAWIGDALAAVGVSEAQAASVASALAQADARGLHSHGCEMLPRYVAGFEAGFLNRSPAVRQVGGRRAFARWDGDNALGHYTCDVVADELVDRARDCGIAAAVVANSNHFGIASRYGLRFAEHALIGFVTTNTPAVMPVPGGRDAVIGNNPLSWVLPRRQGDPITLDMAVSASSRGRIRLAATAGEPIPPGWATGPDGSETTDASVALAGALLPVAGPKGYGLAVVNEILSAALSGAQVLTEISTRTIVSGDLHDEWRIGHFLLAIDPEVTGPIERYHERVERVAEILTANRDTDGVPARLPGDPEAERERSAAVGGVPLPGASAAAVSRLCSALRLAEPW